MGGIRQSLMRHFRNHIRVTQLRKLKASMALTSPQIVKARARNNLSQWPPVKLMLAVVPAVASHMIQRKAGNSISQESWVMFMILTNPREFNSNEREQSTRIKSIDEKPIQVVVDRELCFTDWKKLDHTLRVGSQGWILRSLPPVRQNLVEHGTSSIYLRTIKEKRDTIPTQLWDIEQIIIINPTHRRQKCERGTMSDLPKAWRGRFFGTCYLIKVMEWGRFHTPWDLHRICG